MHYFIAGLKGDSKAYFDLKEHIGLGPEDKLYILGNVMGVTGSDVRGCFDILEDAKNNENIELILGCNELIYLNYLKDDNANSKAATAALIREKDKTQKPLLSYLDQMSEEEIGKIINYFEKCKTTGNIKVGEKLIYFTSGKPAEYIGNEDKWMRETAFGELNYKDDYENAIKRDPNLVVKDVDMDDTIIISGYEKHNYFGVEKSIVELKNNRLCINLCDDDPFEKTNVCVSVDSEGIIITYRVSSCSEVIYSAENIKFDNKPILSPKAMVEYLDKYIIGQEQAKKSLAVAVYNHYKSIKTKDEDMKIPKNNVILYGPTGCGKTYILQKLAELMNVPFHIADASLITEASYKGNDIEGIISGLYQAAGKDIKKTEKGIIFLDEFDKLSSRFGANPGDRNVGAGVQRQMLKMIEGSVMEVPENSYRINGTSVMINTSNILFVCGGAFEGIKNKASNNNPIGFCKEFKTIENNDKPTAEDFVKYGFVRELIGRLPAIVGVEALTIQDLIDILEKAEGSILKKYVTVFDKLYNVKLEFTKGAIEEIAKQAYNKGIGARGLNSIVGDLVQELMYEAPSNPAITGCCITAEVVKKIAEPQIIYYQDER